MKGYFNLLIIFTKWEYQPKECFGPSAHSIETLLETCVLLLLSLPQLIYSCETCMCVSLCICQFFRSGYYYYDYYCYYYYQCCYYCYYYIVVVVVVVVVVVAVVVVVSWSKKWQTHTDIQTGFTIIY